MCIAENENPYVVVTVVVTVHVDPADDELRERRDQFEDRASVDDVVRAEIESNLESVSYVRHVSVETIERR